MNWMYLRPHILVLRGHQSHHYWRQHPGVIIMLPPEINPKNNHHVANTAADTCLIILWDRNTHKTLTQTFKLWQASAAQRHKRFAAATRSNFSRTSAAGDFRSATLACCQQTSFVCWTYRQSPPVCHLTQTHACTNRCSVRCKRAEQPQKHLGDFGLSFIISHNLETSVYALSCCVHHLQSWCHIFCESKPKSHH